MNTEGSSRPSSPTKTFRYVLFAADEMALPTRREHEGFGNHLVNDAFVTTCARHSSERTTMENMSKNVFDMVLPRSPNCGGVAFMTLKENSDLASLALTLDGLGRRQFEHRHALDGC